MSGTGVRLAAEKVFAFSGMRTSVTCRLQGRSLFLYLTEVLSAKIRGDPIPLLA